MAFPTGWGRKCAIVIDAAYVSGTSHADFPVLLTEDILPSEMFDADGSYPALNGGGDIRFSSDSAGSTPLACDVVSFVTDNNPANGSAEIWVKVPTLSGSTDTTIYVWYSKSGESQPAVTDTYGRNAVWADYIAVWHFEGTGTQTDSTGNGHSAAATNISNFAGKFGGSGGAIELNGSSSYLLVSDAAALRIHESGDPDWIASGWVLPDLESTSNQQLINKYSEYGIWAVSADTVSGNLKFVTGTYGSNNLSTVTEVASVGSWNKFDIKVDVGTNIQTYINGSANGGAHSTSDTSVGSTQALYIGAFESSGTGPTAEHFDGKFDEFRLRNSNSANVTADWVATEYNNQSAPGTFAAAGTPVAGGGGVSGTGDLVGAGSQVVGTGTRTVTGTGALEGQGAEVVGTATRTITGTGALVGQGSDVSGTGAAGGTHTGTGDLVGAGSEIVGVGERTVTGTGTLVAQGSAVAGVGERTVTGSGDLVGAGAEVSGSGAIGGITTGTGDLVGAGSEIVGTGLRTVTGSGALVAQGSAVTGTGERTVTGAGALVGSGSEIVGAGVGGDVTTGAGALVGQGSAVTGTGTRTITGVGELVAAGSIIVGSGLRTITGSGALVGAGSEVVGTYVATIVEPSLFQTAADTIIDVFAAAHGQTITLALDSGTVTITGFMRKRPKDWNTPDGKMRGSGWQIVCKGWEISSSDLEGMSGKRATVDGDAYYIVYATPKTSGTLVLDIGYAN